MSGKNRIFAHVMTEKEITKAYRTLETYAGQNPTILYYKRLHEQHRLVFDDDFKGKYILKNADYETRAVNRIVRISSDFGSELQKDNNLDFTPDRILLISIVGEMGKSYHCYIQYRKSVPPVLRFVKKHFILTDFMHGDYTKTEIDFEPWDCKVRELGRPLREHQKSAVKFLVTNKRCILADGMGLGKSSSAIVASLAAGCEKILVITTASLKSTWKREISLYEDPENLSVVNGDKWILGKKFTVVNYDIVQNFYEVAYEDKYEMQAIKGNGEAEWVRVPVLIKDKKTGGTKIKQQKSRKKAAVEAALAKSPLFLSKFDCVIIDEAQKLSNRGSIRYEVISDFLSKAKPEYLFLVTGTPLTNNPMNLYSVLRLINADVTSDYEYYVKRYCGGEEMFAKGEWGKWLTVYTSRNGGSWATMTKKQKRECEDFINGHARKLMIPNDATNLDELKERIKHLYIRRTQDEIPGMVEKKVETRYYDLTDEQRVAYDKLWDEYVEAQTAAGNEDNEEYRQLVEGMLIRKYLAREMTANTIQLCDEHLADGEKVIIMCSFRDEMQTFKEYYGDKCVMFDGEMTAKQKEKAEKNFMENPKKTVFIGQYVAASVGLTLTISKFLVFNSFSWVAADNFQAEDRIYRITQKEDVTCVYQIFSDTILEDMYEKVLEKARIMKKLIVKEANK